MKVHYEKPTAEAELMVAGMKKATELIDTSTSNKRKIALPIETRHSRKQKVKVIQEMDQVEYDEMYVGEDNLSVGTTIKRAALKLFHENKIRKLSARERKIMTNGLSSILDLVDHSSSSQKILFSNEAWSQITSRFELDLNLELLPISRFLTSSWLIICATIVSSNDITLGLDYIYKIYSKQTVQNKSYLKLFEHVLNFVENYPHLLKSNGATNNDYSESDILRILWSPIFELLFPPNKHNLIVKTGETISTSNGNGYTFHKSQVENKQDTYGDSSRIIAFKTDIRVIFNNQGKGIDIVSGEVAKNDEDSKIIADEGKLSRETKDAVDSILALVGTTAQALGVQISGSTCMIATQQLTANGLYVCHPAFSFSLPCCIEELKSFESSMQKLISFQQHVITIANTLEKAVTNKYSLSQQFGKNDKDNSKAASILDWRRDTFYSPPRNKEARVPTVLFGSPSGGLMSRLLKAKYTEGNEGIVYDQFGWGKKDDGKWHNKITNEVQDENPYFED